MFCAIHVATTIEKCKTEGVVDVFQIVKALRVQKPGAVTTVVSCHSDVIMWIVVNKSVVKMCKTTTMVRSKIP